MGIVRASKARHAGVRCLCAGVEVDFPRSAVAFERDFADRELSRERCRTWT